MRDLKRLQQDPPGGISASPNPDNIMLWNAVIFGPAVSANPLINLALIPYPFLIQDTPFEDGTFKLILQFDETYPTKPPSVKFVGPMFHPNVYNTGELCLDILQNRW